MTKFEQFKQDFKDNPDSFREELRGSGSFEFSMCVDLLKSLEFKLNGRLLEYLFGTTLGLHYASKFSSHRNIIKLISEMGDEEQIFILHELKTNNALFVHCLI